MNKEQNIFDNQAFFDGYKALRERDDNLNLLLEQPAMKRLLPDMAGRSVLDLGCGYGHNCMDFVKRGAAEVVGVDISGKMLEIAKTESPNEKIRYINMSMTDIKSLDRRFDVIYSSLAFHYIEDFAGFAADIYDVLNSGGWLLFSQEHPIPTATIDGKGHFNFDENGERTSYTLSDYHREGKRVISWFVDGVVKYHRTFGSIVTALAKAGFVIDTVEEPLPEEWALKKLPSLNREFIKPNYLIVKARKP